MRFEADTFQSCIEHIISQAFLNRRTRYACRSPPDVPCDLLLGLAMVASLTWQRRGRGRAMRDDRPCYDDTSKVCRPPQDQPRMDGK
jgi:hypothetical protein